MMMVVVVVGKKIAVKKVEIWVGARVPLGVGGERGALRPVGGGMLALRCVHKARRRDGRGDAMVVVVVEWYRYRYQQQARSAPHAAQRYRAQYVYLRIAYHPRARAIAYILT
jgi:hypothetical protein